MIRMIGSWGFTSCYIHGYIHTQVAPSMRGGEGRGGQKGKREGAKGMRLQLRTEVGPLTNICVIDVL